MGAAARPSPHPDSMPACQKCWQLLFVKFNISNWHGVVSADDHHLGVRFHPGHVKLGCLLRDIPVYYEASDATGHTAKKSCCLLMPSSVRCCTARASSSTAKKLSVLVLASAEASGAAASFPPHG